MPVRKSLSGNEFVETIPKKTSQGRGKHTKYAATSSNKPKKTYQGKGKHTKYAATSANKPKKRYRGQGR